MKSVAAGLVILMGCMALLGATGTKAATTTVYIVSFEFEGASGQQTNPVIALYDTVTWVWSNGTHSTTAAPGQLEQWDSGAQNTSPTATNFSHTFTNLGTYNYYCSVHSQSTGCRQVGPKFSFSMMTGYVAVVTGALSGPYEVNQITQTGSDIVVSWVTGGICFTNVLQRSTGDPNDSFDTNTFADIFTVTNTVGNTTNYLDAGALTNFSASYYRVRVPL